MRITSIPSRGFQGSENQIENIAIYDAVQFGGSLLILLRNFLLLTTFLSL
jgi:hypothetical protein